MINHGQHSILTEISDFDVHRRPGVGRGPVKMRNLAGSRPTPGRRGL